MAKTIIFSLRLRHWPIIRWVKLAMGLMFVMAGIDGHETVIAILGFALSVSSLFGWSNCHNGCANSFNQDASDSLHEQNVQHGN